MIRGIESVLLFTSNAKNLASFYQKTVGLTQTSEGEVGENGEALFGFEMKQGSPLYIMDHSKVRGKTKEPSRFMVNLEVDDIEKEVKRLKKAKVALVQDIYHLEDYGYIATFSDPDGNYFQLVQVRAS